MELKKLQESYFSSYERRGLLFESRGLGALWRHFHAKSRGFIAISAMKGDYVPKHEIEGLKGDQQKEVIDSNRLNKRKHKALLEYLKAHNLGYWVTDGTWVERTKSGEDGEKSREISVFIPFNPKAKKPSNGEDDMPAINELSANDFFKHAKRIARIYGQDAVVVKLPGDSHAVLWSSIDRERPEYDLADNKFSSFRKKRDDDELWSTFKSGKHGPDRDKPGISYVFEELHGFNIPSNSISAMSFKARKQLYS